MERNRRSDRSNSNLRRSRSERNSDKKNLSINRIIFVVIFLTVAIFLAIYFLNDNIRNKTNRRISNVFGIELNNDADNENKSEEELLEEEKRLEAERLAEIEREQEEARKEFEKEPETEEEKAAKENLIKQMEEEARKEEEYKLTPEYKAIDILNKEKNPENIYYARVLNKETEEKYIVSLVNPDTTVMIAVFEVNIATGEINEL